MPSYQLSDLKTKANVKIHGAISDADYLTLINNAVQEVISEIDLRSTKRSAELTPRLFDEVYTYACPTDLLGTKVVDIQPQTDDRKAGSGYDLVTVEEFDRRKRQAGSNLFDNLIAISDKSMTRKLLVSAISGAKAVVLNLNDSITGNGTWTVGGDATNLTRDTVTYVNPPASLNFDTNSGATTAYLENSTMTAVDLTDYENQSLFVWVYIAATSGVSSYNLRWGSSSSAYWDDTVTTTNEGASFATGWNLLRFDWEGATETGSPDITAINYLRFTMNKTAGRAASTDERIGRIVARVGVYQNVIYYSKYPWQNTSGTFLENATATTDYLNAEADELQLIVANIARHGSWQLENERDTARNEKDYLTLLAAYRRDNPSETKVTTGIYYELNNNDA